MKNTNYFKALLAGAAIFSVIAVAVILVPNEVDAYSPYYGGYGYNNYNHGYVYPNPYPTAYPPAPSSYNTPTVQVSYGNGYYYNYIVPTVRVYPPVVSHYQPNYHTGHYSYQTNIQSSYSYSHNQSYNYSSSGYRYW